MPINFAVHAILTIEEQNTICTALDFFAQYNSGLIQRDDFEQARLAYREHGGKECIDALSRKIATLS